MSDQSGNAMDISLIWQPAHDHQPGPFVTVTQVSALLVYLTATSGNGHNAAAQPEAGAIDA